MKHKLITNDKSRNFAYVLLFAFSILALVIKGGVMWSLEKNRQAILAENSASAWETHDDYDQLIEKIIAQTSEEFNEIEEISELSLIIGEGQTVHEQSYLEQTWYSFRYYFQGGSKEWGTYP